MQDDQMEPTRVEVARTVDTAGEFVLTRHGSLWELTIDGVFSTDSVNPRAQEELALLALDLLCQAVPARVLVGGLGLGYTARALLDDPRIGDVEVVEVHQPLVDWAHKGVLPTVMVSDPRLTVTVGEVAAVVPSRRGLDVVLLEHHRSVHTDALLATVGQSLREGGVLGIWSAASDPELLTSLGQVFTQVEEVQISSLNSESAMIPVVYLALI